MILLTLRINRFILQHPGELFFRGNPDPHMALKILNWSKRYMATALLLAAAIGLSPHPVVRATTQPLPEPGDTSADFAARATQVEERAANFIRALQERRFEDVRDMLSEGVRAELTVEDIQKRWDEIVASVGDLQQMGKTRYEWAVNTDFVAIELEFDRTTGDLLLSFDSDQQISSVDFPPLREADARIIAEKAIDAIANRDYLGARSDLHPILKSELTPEAIGEKWINLQTRAGDFRRRVATQIRKTDDFQLVSVTLEFENLTEDILFFFNSENQILGVDFPN